MFSHNQNSYNVQQTDEQSSDSSIELNNDCNFHHNCFYNNRVMLLLWKNLKIKIRRPWKSLFWMLIPCIFSVVMVLVQMAAEKQLITTPTIYPPHSINEDVILMEMPEKQVLYTPITNATNEIMNYYKENTQTNTVIGFVNETDLIDYYLQENSEKICCAIIFNNIESTKIDFTVRFPFIPTYFQNDYSMSRLVELTWKTTKQWPKYIKSGPRSPNNSYGGPPDYFNNGFLFVQHEVSRASAYYYDSSAENFYNQIQMFVQRYPYPPYQKSDFLFYLQIIFPLNFLLSFLSISLELTKDIVLEKEMRLKEIMKIMGLQDWMHWLSWFIYSFVWNISFGLILTLILCVPFGGEAILNYSNPIIVFLFTMAYVLSIITFCFLMSSLPKISDKADFAGTISAATYFLLFLPYYFVNFNYDDIPFGWRLACGLSYNVNMPFGLMILSRWENSRIGLQWSNIWQPLSSDDPMTIGHVFVIFLIDSVIQFTLALYFNAVFPGKYGVGEKWYFFIQPSYWCKSRYMDEEVRPAGCSTGIQIINLCKSYDGGKTFAVKRLKLNLLCNQITVLLGHNGAGKTSLMSMLCGLIPPTSGSVFLDGISLRREMEKVRQNLGICPQFDVLFDHLTVEEHFWFYCKIKNIDDKIIEDEIETMIRKLNLQSKRRHLAKTLSGGMRRKLSVGIALSGGSKFVLLDEATSGMDVSARRFIWDLLIQEKHNRTILFSTHFMEEADVLGEKIAIMQQGQLQCFGSPYQLRKDFQIGYLLKISVERDANKQKIIELTKSHVTDAKLLALTNNEMTFSLPDNQPEKFESFFSFIEQNNTELGIDNFGISVSTIEEVFLRANKFQFESLDSDGVSSSDLIDKIKHHSLEHSSKMEHFVQVFYSQFVKKAKFLSRNRFLLLAHFVLPSLVLVIGILSGIGVLHNLTHSPALHINLEPYRTVYATSFFQNDSQTKSLGETYGQILAEHPNVILNSISAENIEETAIDYLTDNKYYHSSQNNLHYLVSASFSKNIDGQINVTALFNNQAYHSSTISVALVDEALLRYSLNKSDFGLSVWNEPLPKKPGDTINAREFDSVFQTHILSCLQISICFLMASFSLLLVVEKSSNFKFIQQISGLKMHQYWISNFIMDYVIYIISVLILVLVFIVFNVKAFASIYHQAFMMLMFLFNGLASLPFIYLLAYLFKDQYTAYVQITLVFFLTGFSSFITVLLLRIGEFNLFQTSQLLDTIFTFTFPIYTITMAIFSIYDNYVGISVCYSTFTFANMTFDIQKLCHDDEISNLPGQIIYCCKEKCKTNCFRFNENYFSWETPGIGKYIAASVFLATIFWTILAILEGRIGKFLIKMLKLFNLRRKSSMLNNSQKKNTIPRKDLDDDVLAEENRIIENHSEMAKTHAMIVKNVSKNYGKLKAVRNISFAVERAECFGMLGENGAGKTTTFQLITGATKLTTGDVWINNYNINDSISQVFKDIGYCPQFDGLLNELTGRETLAIICRIRGIKEELIEQQIKHLSELLQFSRYIDRIVDEYSGGTKRKLSFAMSIAGNPLITFLDEPTTGIDPVSRRGLWNAIRLVRSGGSSLVLTSHSMEECEALCNRLVIMVNGKIRCIGSPLHLKRKFGNGHMIQIKLRSKSDIQKKLMSPNQLRMINACKEIALHKFMEKNFPCKFESKYENLYTYRIVANDMPLSVMFGLIEKAKKRLHIEHYSINQPSLEKIFLTFISQKSKTDHEQKQKVETLLNIC